MVLSASVEYCVCGYRGSPGLRVERLIGKAFMSWVQGHSEIQTLINTDRGDAFIKILVPSPYLDLGFPVQGPSTSLGIYEGKEYKVTSFCLESRRQR